MSSPRLAVPVIALSVISDLAKGFDEGQALRTAVLAVRLARRLTLPAATVSAAYWVALLRFTGCTATASEMAAELGDEIAVSAAFAGVDPTELRSVVASALKLYEGRPDQVVKLLLRAPAVIRRHEVASCEVAGLLARGIGLPDIVVDGLRMSFERYDGRGHPGHARGIQIPLATRVAQAAQLAELTSSAAPDTFAATIQRAAGKSLDPGIAGFVSVHAESLLDGIGAVTPDDALAAEPLPHMIISEPTFDSTARAIGAVVDIKSSYFIGHSDRVAQCAAAAAVRAGLPVDQVHLISRAGWLHDVGRAAVSSRIWNKAEPLTAVERELVEAHPYFSRRVLGQVPGWDELATLAAAHHERLDGSGYPAGQRGASSAAAAILSAADLYCTLGEHRPNRAALSEAARRDQLEAAVRDGKLDASAVAAVLDHRAPPSPTPVAESAAELTERERTVLGLVAQGLTNRAVGTRLGISAKTVNTHLEHVFAKFGVSCRAAAVFQAARSGQVGAPIG